MNALPGTRNGSAYVCSIAPKVCKHVYPAREVAVMDKSTLTHLGKRSSCLHAVLAGCVFGAHSERLKLPLISQMSKGPGNTNRSAQHLQVPMDLAGNLRR
jgi:hypothetical protein